MKKLMIAAAIVCAAALSHGAAVTWNMTGISNAAAGDVAYLMAASAWDEFSGLTSDKVGKFCADNFEDTITMIAGRGGASITGKTSDSYTPGTKESFFIVLFDDADATKADHYANTAVTQITIPSGGDGQFTTTFAGNTEGWQEIADVPEPTSGLLMLVGMGALALRRRRA